MKDIPVFVTEFGAASLILREVAYQEKAYIRLQATQQPRELLEECIGFCKAVGAAQIYATGHAYLEAYPFYTAIVQMQCPTDNLPVTDAALWPLQEAGLPYFLEIYRKKVRSIPNGAWLTDADGLAIAKKGTGYFVHRQGELLGIGIVEENELRFVASLKPGAGETCVRALASLVQEDSIVLQVASTNQKAISLYEKLGFLPVRELSRWYCVASLDHD